MKIDWKTVVAAIVAGIIVNFVMELFLGDWIDKLRDQMKG